jgi:hypothetical protein
MKTKRGATGRCAFGALLLALSLCGQNLLCAGPRAADLEGQVAIRFTDARDIETDVTIKSIPLYVGPSGSGDLQQASAGAIYGDKYEIDFPPGVDGDLSGRIVFRNNFLVILPVAGTLGSQGRNDLTDQDGKNFKAVWFESQKMTYKALKKRPPIIFDIYDLDLARSGYSKTGLLTVWDQLETVSGFLDRYSSFVGQTDVRKMHRVAVAGSVGVSNPSYVPADKRLVLDSQTRGDNSLLLHEYGHAVFHAQFGNYAYADPKCGDPISGHHLKLDRSIDEQCAFIEGWADFFAVAMTSTFGYLSDGTFEYAVAPIYDFTPKNKKDAKGFETDELDFSTSYYSMEPKNEGYVTSVLWRLNRYGGVPMVAFLNALSAMKDDGLGVNDLTLAKYLPYLARSYKKLNVYSAEEIKRGVAKKDHSTILAAFARAAAIWKQALNE